MGEEPSASEAPSVSENTPSEDESAPSVGDSEPSVSENTISISENSLSIKANNSLGDLLLEELQIEARNTEEEAAVGYAVADIEVSGTEAVVLLHAKESCTAVVVIYEERSEKPYAFGSATVEAGENQVAVEIKADSLPQYFEAKGYLVDTDTLRPLSKEYSSLMYTRAMQEFLAKTADDFGDAAVINLDEDKETNFLVLNDGNLLIKEEAGQNRLVSYDEESDTYTFANVSDSVKGLKQGDIFLYQYDENEWDFYIIKVEQIELQETDGVTYLGRESGAVGYAIEGDPSLTIEKDFWQLPREDSDDHTFGDYVSGKFGGEHTCRVWSNIYARILSGLGIALCRYRCEDRGLHGRVNRGERKG